MNRPVNLTRREFLRLAGLGLGGLTVSSLLSACGLSFDLKTISPLAATAPPSPELATPSASGELVDISLRAAPARFNILPGGETRVWQYQGSLLQGPPGSLQSLPDSYLGPILRLRRGQTLRVNFVNQIKEPSIIHWHGLSVPDDMDGHPRNAIDHGQTYTYEFPILNRAGTYWYHPHPHQRTGPQVYYGLAGLLIVSDDEEAALGLPAGEFDLPLVIQDRLFDRQNQLVYAANPMAGFFGDQILVNGQAGYILEATAAPYRLRLLNGSNARIYKLAWDDSTPLSVIATDGGLLEKPVQRSYVTLAPGERVELYADFSADPIGKQRQLVSRAFEGGSGGMGMMGGGMMGGNTAGLPQGAEMNILGLKVTRAGQAGRGLGERLSAPGFFAAQDAANARRPRRLDLTMHMTGLINGRTFEMDSVASDEVVRLGDLEVWEFANLGGGMGMMGGSGQAHPMHIHNVQYQVLERRLAGGSTWAYNTLNEGYVDSGWKDTVLVLPDEVVRLLVKFDHYAGLYLYHCHNLEHEDGGMMRNYRIES
ncbi:MAG: multicopper oxidase domain-containing protein [Anaerolineaceae bacterium]